ncbi:MAG TPA: 3D domain-containing protein [Pyrinomonadaceae bacterium]|nr:3D domain-containing protein [Pyrinomonadaceae bacterium]HMP66970.1 3D domain-containing protein [Pyrinomonadaceae bacterium]
MKNLVRGGIILSVLSLFVVFIYAQSQTENELNIADNSQTIINTEEINKTDDQEVNKEQENKAKDQEINNKKSVNTKADQKQATNNEEQENKARGQVKRTGSSRAVSRGRFVATAYCLRGRTASGANVRRGIIAADPRVLRLGTRVSLGAGAYSGEYLVADTGGRIKGNKIDIWMASCSEARRFGRRNVTLSVMN